MRRGICIILLFMCLSGCKEKVPAAQPPIVAVEICTSSPCTPDRCYRDPEKLQKIFWRLRSMRFSGYTHMDAELLSGDSWNLSVLLSDGTRELYRIRNGCCLCCPGGLWMRIDPRDGRALTELLRQLPGD